MLIKIYSAMNNKYTKFSLAILFLFVFSVSITAQNRDGMWIKIDKEDVTTENLTFRKAEPKKGIYYQLDINNLKNALRNAPNRNRSTEVSNLIIEFPNAEGNLESFRIKEASVMHPELQERYRNIRSYVGQSIDNPGTTIRFSVTPQGLHTMTLSRDSGAQYIDPYSKETSRYIVYAKRDLPTIDTGFLCEFDDEGLQMESGDIDLDAARNANDGMMRDYRLALACTIEYSSFHWMAAGLIAADTEADKKVAVLAAMVVTMTRVNGIYENELSITMTLVTNNDSIIYINSDTFDNANADTLITQSQSAIDNVIMPANYDIGHTFSTGGGGLASLGSVCVGGSKARGITGSPAPVGDAYDVDFVAHEMGHQFGAPHTFNGNDGNCAGNRSPSNAYEVGSGSTIMAYAGICASQNVQSNSDPYFHQKSLQMIWTYVTAGMGGCAVQTATGNTVPTSVAGSSYTIPSLTPYKLTGSSTDPDGTGTHTFTWEQWDLGAAGIPLEGSLGGPLVRSFEGTSNPTRYIPNVPDLFDTGGSTDWEKLSAANRTLNFQLTVRDNDSRGGQTAVDATQVSVANSAGPFLVTSQATDQIVWTPGMTETITWDVAGTTANGINAANVNILLSTDEGVTFDTILVANTPNDGTQDIIVPSVSAPFCRIMVEAAGNIFFAVNDNFLAIGNYVYGAVDVCEDYFFNAGILLDENDMTFSGFILPNIPSVTITDLNVGVDVTTTDNAEIAMGIRGPWDPAGISFLQSGTNNGCSGLPNAIVTFDDEGIVNACTDTSSNLAIQPLQPLDIFADGQDSGSGAGDWVFFVGDIIVDGNRATWNSVTLTICSSEIGPILGVNEFSLEDSFVVYPNPNNGEFNVKLKSNSNQDINIQVFDIRGRSVLNQTYNNTRDFNQNINLNNAQSGMYLLNVSDGERTATKKIIIE